MIFDLVKDFADVLDAMPEAHPRHRIVKLLDEAIRRDVHFIDRHPTTFFQCMWNTCWWYDCPEAAKHYEEPEGGWKEPPPFKTRKEGKLSSLLDQWLLKKEQQTPGFSWLRSLRPPPIHLGTALRAVLHGHKSSVTCVAFTSDGYHVVSGSSDCSVRLWDAEIGREYHRLVGHKNDVTAVVISPDGQTIITSDEDESIRHWSVGTGEQLCISERTLMYEPPEWWAEPMAISLDGLSVVSALDDLEEQEEPIIRVTLVETREELCRLDDGQKFNCSSLAFSKDGRQIVAGSYDGLVQVWDSDTGKVRSRLAGHRWSVSSVAFSPDGHQIVSGGADGTVRLWNPEREHEYRRFDVLGIHVTAVAFSPDGRQIISGSSDGSIRLWDTTTGKKLHHLDGHQGKVTSVAFSPEGRRIVSGSSDAKVRVWDIRASEVLRLLGGHEDAQITSISISPKGDQIASGSSDGTVRCWSGETGEFLHHLEVLCHVEWDKQKAVEAVAYSADGCRIMVKHRSTRFINVCDTATGKHIRWIEGLNSFFAERAKLPIDGLKYQLQPNEFGLDTIVEEILAHLTIAQFPLRPGLNSTHPSSCRWALSEGDHLYLTELSGGNIASSDKRER